MAFDSATSYSAATSTGALGSPLKKARSSVSGVNDDDMRKRFGLGLHGVKADVLGAIEHDRIAGLPNGEKCGNNVGPVAKDGYGLGSGLLSGLAEGGAKDGQVKQEQPKEVKLEDMEEEEL